MDAAKLLPRLIQAARDGPIAVLDELSPHMDRLGLTPRETTGPHRAVLWSRGAPKVALSGHVDVVPVGEGWTREPFGGEVAEGRVWGRGACDMLGSVACFVAAAARRPDAPCAILLTTDEETTMLAATAALSQGLLRGIEAVVVGEPTSMDVGIAEKGVLWLRLTASGRNAHGSMPHLGDNAAERLVRALARLEALKLEGRHPLLGPSTRNLGRLAAGEAVNQVPASATAEVDLRYLPGMSRDDIVAEILRVAGEPLEVEILSDHVPFETPVDAPLVRAALEVAGTRAVGLPYGTEASKYAPAGIPCVILGPGEPGLAHSPRESIGLEALARGTDVYARLLR